MRRDERLAREFAKPGGAEESRTRLRLTSRSFEEIAPRKGENGKAQPGAEKKEIGGARNKGQVRHHQQRDKKKKWPGTRSGRQI